MALYFSDMWEIPSIADWYDSPFRTDSQRNYPYFSNPAYGPVYYSGGISRTAFVCPPTSCRSRRFFLPGGYCIPSICKLHVGCVPRTCHPRYKCDSRRPT